MIMGGADGFHDAFADASDDCFFGGSADEPLEFRAHGYTGFGPQLNSIATASVEELPALRRIRAIDNLRVHARLDGIEDVATGQVNGGGGLPRQIHASLVGRDDGSGRLGHVAAGQVMRLQVLRGDLDAGLYERDLLPHYHAVIDIAELHTHEIENSDARSGQQALNPEPDEAEEDDHHDEADQRDHGHDDQKPRLRPPAIGAGLVADFPDVFSDRQDACEHDATL